MTETFRSVDSATILIVDDSPDVLSGLGAILRQNYSRIVQAASSAQAIGVMENVKVDLVITDLSMPGMDGLELLSHVKNRWPETMVIVVTGFGSIETAVDAMKRGAYHYVAKPFRAEEILIIVDHALQRLSLEREVIDLRRRLAETRKFAGIVAQSKGMIEVFEFIQKVAPTDAPVLIRGESGTGKELVARAIHAESARREGQFLGINAAALPEQLLEAELFGYRKGAFTGAVQDKEGLLTSALGGTVFLDEISRMPMSCQAKLLRAIEEREVLPVGGLQTRRIDVRFISATNADELAEIRDDLYYRLSVMEVHVPPLRERMEDVPLLAAHFLEEYGAKFDRQRLRLSAGALEALMSYEWPGNVRELENVIQRSVIMSAGEEVTADKIWIRARSGGEEFAAAGSMPTYSQGRDRAIAGFQRRYIGELLERAGGNISKASRLAGLTRAAFYAIMKKNGLWSDRRRRRR